MKRRSGAGGAAFKTRGLKATKLKRRKVPNDVARRSSSTAGAEGEVTRLTRELNEALERQTATSEVLNVVSRSTFDLPTVLNTLVKTAVRLCRADKAQLLLPSDNARSVYSAASFGYSPEYDEYLKTITFAPGREGVVGRVLLTRKPVQIADVLADPEYRLREVQRLGGFRTHLGLPLLREDSTIGVLLVSRVVVQPFEDKHIELLSTFAAQAVIAIENARLLNELRQRTTDLSQRTHDLTEALEQQTATSEVLQVISRSSGVLEPVFASMLQNALRICDAKSGGVYRWDGQTLRLAAQHNVTPAYAQVSRTTPFRPNPKSFLGRILASKTLVHIADLTAEPDYIERMDRFLVAVAEVADIRTLFVMPMLKENELIGLFIIGRQEVRPFTDKQIALVTNFAAQAVIAIENARLLNELRQRTMELSVSLERQTATSEILSVISSSPGEIKPVFETILANATRLCEASFGTLILRHEEEFRVDAAHNVPRAYTEIRQRDPVIRSGPLARIVATKQPLLINDCVDDPAYKEDDPSFRVFVDKAGARSALSIPMLKGQELIGTITIFRQEVRSFTDKQIELVQNFAAQAVIAIENARLLNELRERTEQVEAQSHELVKLNQQLGRRVADQVGEIERMGRLRRFLPPQVADLIVASGAEKQLESHRREITALFCDLRGFTGFSESADPEDVSALLSEYHAAIGEKIIKYSGTLERYAGDGVMVVFNDPVPVENPALQAVLMAVEMREAIGALTETWRRWGHDIGFGIGIAHGFATLGTIGFEGRFDYAAIGTVSNVASRLCDEAKPGQILISPRVLTKVENAVTVEPVGEFTLKGIRRPLAAYNVLAAKATN
jgi:GAF domain-containing protein